MFQYLPRTLSSESGARSPPAAAKMISASLYGEQYPVDFKKTDSFTLNWKRGKTCTLCRILRSKSGFKTDRSKVCDLIDKS